jgi:diadenylate cyclase
MASFFSSPFAEVPKLTVTGAIDILIVAVLVYQFLLIIRGRRAAHVLFGLCILVAIYLVAIWAKLEVLRTILATLAPYTAIALIVMFQSELRRTLARLGRRPFLGISQLERREVTQEILLAIAHLSQRKVGALIVVERKIGLRTFVESGVSLDAAISRDLLCAIFQPAGALHDGAVIIQGNRIAWAACFLPLSSNPLLITELGTRHRAGLGITEESDCVSVIVSEETGKISIAAFSEIELDVPMERVEQLLTGRLDRRDMRTSAGLAPTSPAVRPACRTASAWARKQPSGLFPEIHASF